MSDLLTSEQLKARNFFETISDGQHAHVLPGAFAAGAPAMFVPITGAPSLGANDQIAMRPRPASPSVNVVKAPLASAAGPLSGLRVADFAWVVAGPAIGRVLADYGATVVRVESSTRPDAARLIGPHRDGDLDPERCALYDTFNAGKFGLTLDLSTPAGRSVARDLVGWADVVIESFAPGQLARWGLDPVVLRKEKPGLICMSTTLMGQTGPARKLAGFGNIGTALSGFFMLAGKNGDKPTGPYGPYTDFVGPRFGVVALLTALEHRRTTEQGCWLDISQVESAIQFLAPEVAAAAASGALPVVDGNRDVRFVPHGVFPCRDKDEWIAIVARDDADWRLLAAEIGGEATAQRWATTTDRKANEDELETIVASWSRRHSAADVEQRLQVLRVPAHKVANSQDVVSDTQLAYRGHFIRHPDPRGGHTVVDASKYELSETPAQYNKPAPCLGQDSRWVLGNLLGYSEENIARLEEAGVLR